ncbi:MAG: glycosyltransferase [Phycisphaerales bacterium]|nr:MAG: glycosyltransferase [Phycisphaerales bacterium]
MNLRVLHVIDHLVYGGAAIAVKNIVERMGDAQIETFLCVLRANPNPMPVGANLISLNSHKYSPFVVPAIAALCKKHEIHIVHAHLQKAVIGSLLAGFLCKSKIVVHEHGPILTASVGALYRMLLRMLVGNAAVLVANSQATRIALNRATRVPKECIPIVGNFIDFARFDPKRYDRTRARETLGICEGQTVVGYVGRLEKDKGADLAVGAAKILSDRGRRCRFLIVGEGRERRALEKMIRRLNLGGTVSLMGLSHNPAELMAAFDIGLVPSRCEAFGITAVELMRMMIPVIASPAGGLVELVHNEKTGILLEKLSSEQIADAIDRLLRQPSLRQTIVSGARDFSCRFDGGEQLQKIRGIYEKLRS